MNYELAKELKDAGFPHSQTWEDRGSWYERENNVVPTLTELIEACGTKLRGLRRSDDPDNTELDGGWFADTNFEEKNFASFGPTPEEAVARLWLALNKK